MKKISYVIILLFSLFLLRNNVLALECSYEEQLKINQDSSAISVNYSQNGAYLKVFINNLSSNYYAKIVNTDGTESIYNGNDNLEPISFDWYKVTEPYEMSIAIYTSSNTNCPDTYVLNKDITLPMYNKYSEKKDCINNENLYVCQKFVDVEVTEQTFDAAIKKVNNTSNNNVKNDEEKTVTTGEEKESFFSKNKVLIISISSVIVIGTIIGILGVKSRRKII